MPSKKVSMSNEKRKQSLSSNSKPCPLMFLVSAVEVLDNIHREEHIDEQRRQAKVMQELHEKRHDDDRGEDVKADAEERADESNVEQEDNNEEDEHHKREVILADSETNLKSMSIANQGVVRRSNQVDNLVEFEEMSPDGSQREAGAESEAIVPMVVPETIRNDRNEINLDIIHSTTGEEDERVLSNKFQVDSPSPTFQHNVNQPYQAAHEILDAAQITAQMKNMDRKFSGIRLQLIRAVERIQLLENALLVRKDCIHCTDRDSHNNGRRNEQKRAHRRDRSDRRSEAVEEWKGDHHSSVEGHPTNANNISSPTEKSKENEHDMDQNGTVKMGGSGTSIMEESTGLRQLHGAVAQITEAQAGKVTEAPADKTTVEQVKGSVLGKRNVSDNDVGKEETDSKEEVNGRGATNGKRSRRSVAKRRRVNWSVEDNYLFMRIVRGNRHLGETRIRRKLADTFSAHRTHEQCANHLRILRAQGRLPPVEDEPPTSNSR